MLFARLLARVIRFGDLTVLDALGRRHRFGGPPLPGVAPVTIRLHRPSLHWRLFLDPQMGVGDAYMDGTLTIEDGGLGDFVALCAANIERGGHDCIALADRLTAASRRLRQLNPVGRARRNAAHHYDLPEEFFALFLDADRQYSCAYFEHPGMTLEEAQEAKKRRIAAKLLLRPGLRVLDIGSGWGGLGLGLARSAGVEVDGITLSAAQVAASRRRAAEAGLADQVRFHLRDYRHQRGRFDRIVSIGMFEHVGVNHYRGFFGRLAELLAEDGVALLHSIGRAGGPGHTNAWVDRHIFPGGYIPALSEVLPAVERSGLWVTDVEILRLHYAETVHHWRRRFQAARARVCALYDERFYRMWEFYLAGAEAAFRHQDLMVFQLQLAHRREAVPLTRRYLADTPQPLSQSAAQTGRGLAALSLLSTAGG